MSDFESAFKRLMFEEGVGLSNDPLDKGQVTFAGISRKFHPDWPGWKYIDSGANPPTQLVRDFYHATFWMPVRGGDIKGQKVAEVLFSQFVNMGANAIKLAQTCVGVVADGRLGPKSLVAINEMPEKEFLMTYALANIARYHAIGMKDKSQRKFWPGWIARGLRVCK